jgi:hypothetical protein
MSRIVGSCCALLLVLLSATALFSQVRQPARMPQRPAPGYGYPAPAQNQPMPAGPPFLKMRVEEDHVTAEIRNTLWQRVVEELAARTGIIFEVQTQENALLSLTLYRVDLQEAVQRIVGERNSIYYFGAAGNQNRLQFVRVFPRKDIPPQPSIRYIGTGTVTNSGDDQIENADQALKVLVDSQNVDARQKAIEVLVADKSDLAYQVLLVEVGDAAPEMRVAAIEGLASLGAHSALPLILLSLKDSNPGVRQSAVTAVALLGDANNVRQLRPLGRDSDANVAAAAEMAIRKLSMPRP